MTEENIMDLSKEFVGRLRSHLSASADAEPDEAIERFISGASAVAGVALMFWPGKRKETLAMALITTAVRHFAKAPKEPPVRLVQ